MSLDFESILPQREYTRATKNGQWYESEWDEGFNKCLEMCLNRLKSYEQKKEICKPLSVEEIEAILFEDDPQGARTPHGQAEAIHRAMTNKDNK